MNKMNTKLKFSIKLQLLLTTDFGKQIIGNNRTLTFKKNVKNVLAVHKLCYAMFLNKLLNLENCG